MEKPRGQQGQAFNLARSEIPKKNLEFFYGKAGILWENPLRDLIPVLPEENIPKFPLGRIKSTLKVIPNPIAKCHNFLDYGATYLE